MYEPGTSRYAAPESALMRTPTLSMRASSVSEVLGCSGV